MRYPALIGQWAKLFRGTDRVMDGLVWYFVEASVSTNELLEGSEVDFQLEYGSYTLGAHGRTFIADPGRPYEVSTRFQVPDGPVPVALAIQVKGEWYRFPIEQR